MARGDAFDLFRRVMIDSMSRSEEDINPRLIDTYNTTILQYLTILDTSVTQ